MTPINEYMFEHHEEVINKKFCTFLSIILITIFVIVPIILCITAVYTGIPVHLFALFFVICPALISICWVANNCPYLFNNKVVIDEVV